MAGTLLPQPPTEKREPRRAEPAKPPHWWNRPLSFGDRTARVVVIVAAIMLFGGWQLFITLSRGDDGSPVDETVRNESGEVVEGGLLDPYLLQDGDCFSMSERESGEVSLVLAVPCSGLHTYEVYSSVVLPYPADAPFPGQKALQEEAGQWCEDQFEDFVGMPYAESQYEAYAMTPQKEAWYDGERTSLCAIANLTGQQVTGTARDAQR